MHDPEDVRRTAVVIEDDADIAALIGRALSSLGFDVTVAPDGPTGVELVVERDPDLVTLDVGLPGIDGLEVCRRIRPLTEAYVVIVTSMADEIDRLIGLETGADDYLAKPINVRELKARVNAMFRRPRRSRPTRGPDATETLRHGDLVVEVDGHRVLCAGEEVDLTPTEFELLTTLMRAPGRVWSRSVLLTQIWGQPRGETHLVEVHMGNLRRKLGDRRGQVRFVENVRGIGYRMRDAS